jgi:nicotinate-nucleotide adenylyltransferase
MVKKKIALFGGTFDPIHLGHTIVAADAAEHLKAEKVIFVPAKRSPLKHLLPRASDNDRLAMITLAIASNKMFEASDYELKKDVPSYTLQTVRQFQTDYGSDTSIYWLIGADSIGELPYWYEIGRLIDECGLCVMYRAGFAVPDFARFTAILGVSRVEKLQLNIIRTPLIDISSTEIRKRLAAGDDITDMLDPKVADYIREHGLYRSKAMS